MAEARQRTALRTGHAGAPRPVPSLPSHPARAPAAALGRDTPRDGRAGVGVPQRGHGRDGTGESRHLAALPSSGGLPPAPVRIGRSLRPPLPPFLLFPPPRGGFRPSSFLGERGSSLKREKKRREKKRKEIPSRVPDVSGPRGRPTFLAFLSRDSPRRPGPSPAPAPPPPARPPARRWPHSPPRDTSPLPPSLTLSLRPARTPRAAAGAQGAPAPPQLPAAPPKLAAVAGPGRRERVCFPSRLAFRLQRQRLTPEPPPSRDPLKLSLGMDSYLYFWRRVVALEEAFKASRQGC
ncbi:basic proline-rich protein-like [Melopsittacus undulatus]|uniref:basic proline-rich protein-like n=1 Tax=Melopsittacus undulatus TaxID=13146 RepID=UPI00146A596C|nr:basic proline-rich protein-like [Melopsittacus undulatus]